MQTFHPDLISHMDARRDQRELAARWRIARASKPGARRASAREAGARTPATTGAAAVVSP